MSKLQVVKELHSDARRNFPRRKFIIRGIDETFQADLVEMIPYASKNQNFKYILTVIDVFSKFAWAFPIKNKTGIEVTKAMENIFKKDHRIPKNMQTDLGKEFYNKNFSDLMKNYKINHYSTYSAKKAAIVERFNRTLKRKMWMQFNLQGTYRWLKMLPTLIDEYNGSKHRTIKMKPIDVNERNEQHLLDTVYNTKIIVPFIKRRKGNKFEKSDWVRISKYKSVFEKGYEPNWTTEVFQIRKIQKTYPITYLLKDHTGEEIAGAFYAHELLKTKHPDIYLVEKIIKYRGNRIYVKWLGFDAKFNSWIDKKDLVK